MEDKKLSLSLSHVALFTDSKVNPTSVICLVFLDNRTNSECWHGIGLKRDPILKRSALQDVPFSSLLESVWSVIEAVKRKRIIRSKYGNAQS